MPHVTLRPHTNVLTLQILLHQNQQEAYYCGIPFKVHVQSVLVCKFSFPVKNLN